MCQPFASATWAMRLTIYIYIYRYVCMWCLDFWNVKIPFALKWLNVTLFHAVLSRLSALFWRSVLASFFFFVDLLPLFQGWPQLCPSPLLSHCPSVKCISISVRVFGALLLALVVANQHAPNSLSIIWQFHWPPVTMGFVAFHLIFVT